MKQSFVWLRVHTGWCSHRVAFLHSAISPSRREVSSVIAHIFWSHCTRRMLKVVRALIINLMYVCAYRVDLVNVFFYIFSPLAPLPALVDCEKSLFCLLFNESSFFHSFHHKKENARSGRWTNEGKTFSV